MGAISHKPRKNRRDADLRDSVSLLPSARTTIGKTRFMPADKEMQNSLGDLLIEWSTRDTSSDIDEFFSAKEIGAMKFYNACENFQ